MGPAGPRPAFFPSLPTFGLVGTQSNEWLVFYSFFLGEPSLPILAAPDI